MRPIARALFLVPLLTGCSELFTARDPARDALLAVYAPDIRLGMRARSIGRARYLLAIAPDIGYEDTTYHAPDTFGRLTVAVTSAPGPGRHTLPIWSRVERISLSSADTAGARRAEYRIRHHLGEPRVELSRTADGRTVRSLYWPARGGRGVRLDMAWDSAATVRTASPAATRPSFTAELTFGAPASMPDDQRRPSSSSSMFLLGQWIYLIARSAAAFALVVLFWRDRESMPHAAGQALADVCAALCVIGFAYEPVRLAFGLWWAAIFLYFAGWQMYRAYEQLSPFGDDGDIWSLDSWGRTVGVFAWETFANAPPLAAGLMLLLFALFPTSIVIPSV